MAARRGRVQVSITGDNSSLKRATRESEGDLARLQKTAGVAGKGLATAAKAATGLAAGYAAITDAKAAVDTTTELAHATLVLHRNLGLSVKSASEFAGVAKVRGIETKALGQSFGTLSKQFVALEGGSKKTVTSFRELGLSQKTLAGKGFEQQLGLVADAFGKMHGGSQRAALGMQLFGRGWQTVLPLMSQGKKGLQDQLALADKYGVTLGGKTVKSLEGLIRAQRESKFATLGLQVAIGTVLAPAMTKAINSVNKFVLGMRDGTGAGGRFADAMKPIASVLGTVGRLLRDHPKLIAGAVAAWGLYKAAGVAATAVTRAKLLGSFVGLGAKAAAGGAVAGAEFGTAASTSASAKMRAFNWTSVGRLIGLAMGVEIASQIAQKVGAENADPLLILHPPSASGNRRADGTYQDEIPLVQRRAVPKLGKSPKLTKKPPTVSGHRAGTARFATGSGPVAQAARVMSGSTARAASAARRHYSGSELAALWVQAGGDRSQANLMAAIALAESGGDSGIVNSIGATGLWQIHPGGAQYLDPMTNARTAVMKLRTQGLGAWEAYTNGSYRQFFGPDYLRSGGGGATAGSGSTLATVKKASGPLIATLGKQVTAVPPKMATPKMTAKPSGTVLGNRFSPSYAASFASTAAAAAALTPGANDDLVARNQRLFSIGLRISQLKGYLGRSGSSAANRKKWMDELSSLQQEAVGLASPGVKGGVALGQPAPDTGGAATLSGIDLIPGAAAGLAAIDKEGALAALTADPGDDIKAAQDAVTGTGSILQWEQTHAGFSDTDIADAARNNKAAIDALDSLTNAVTDNTNAVNDLQAKLDLQTKIAQDAQRNLNTSQSQYGVLAKAISDIANAGIGGRIGLGRQSPSFAGGVARP